MLFLSKNRRTGRRKNRVSWETEDGRRCFPYTWILYIPLIAWFHSLMGGLFACIHILVQALSLRRTDPTGDWWVTLMSKFTLQTSLLCNCLSSWLVTLLSQHDTSPCRERLQRCTDPPTSTLFISTSDSALILLLYNIWDGGGREEGENFFVVFKPCVDSLVPLSVWPSLPALHIHLHFQFIPFLLTWNVSQHVISLR